MINPHRPYTRIEIDKQFSKVKRLMHKNALIVGLEKYGENVAYFEDIYTGLAFKGGDNYEYEHIRSSENIHSKFKATHTDEEIALIVNHQDNVAFSIPFPVSFWFK